MVHLCLFCLVIFFLEKKKIITCFAMAFSKKGERLGSPVVLLLMPYLSFYINLDLVI